MTGWHARFSQLVIPLVAKQSNADIQLERLMNEDGSEMWVQVI